ncbi:MAG: hypothetical protein J0H88_15745 [Sphingomonadales bacterium]|nr:hypothetical protein [Sphingomonadales bacterium]
MKSTWAAAAVLALSLPATAYAATEKPPKLGGMLRCAAVYDVSSTFADEGSDAQILASRRFLQYYLIMSAMAETDANDNLTADTLKTLFNAESELAKAEVTLAKAAGQKGPVFAEDFATCDAFSASEAKLFAVVDEQIDALIAKKD